MVMNPNSYQYLDFGLVKALAFILVSQNDATEFKIAQEKGSDYVRLF